MAHEEYPDTSDARLLDVGYEVCDLIDGSADAIGWLEAASESPMHEDLQSAAVVTLCPENGLD